MKIFQNHSIKVRKEIKLNQLMRKMSEENNILKAHNIDDEERTKDVIINNDVTFNSLMLSPLILDGLSHCDYRKPSPIQQKAIPIGKCGFGNIIYITLDK